MIADEHGVAPDVWDDYPFLRLVKLSSDVLPSHKTVAIVDGRHGGVSIDARHVCAAARFDIV